MLSLGRKDLLFLQGKESAIPNREKWAITADSGSLRDLGI